MTKAEIYKLFGEKDGNKLYKLLNSKCNNFCTFWKKTGNSGTNPFTNFLGTTDNVDLVFKTNNTESFRIFKTTQNIGINTTVDNGFKLNINGNLRVNNGFYVAAPDTLTSDYITGVLKLPQVTIEAVNRSNLSLRMLIRAGGWHTSTWFGAETMPNWVNNGGGNATQNAAFGWGALRYLTTGQNNTATGAFALAGNSLGSTGSNNTGCGYDAAWLISTASQITAVGSIALGDLTTGNNNVGLGYNSGRGVTTGINNTIIGANITGLTANLSDTLIIATGAGGVASYRIFSPSSGNILIGTTVDAGFRLDINGTTRATSLTFTDGTQGLLFGNLSLLRVAGAITSSENISLGRGASATDGGGTGSSLSIGNFSSATGASLAFGITANAGNSGVLDSIAIGRNALIDANVIRGVAIGRNANAKHGNAWAVGYNAVTYMANSFTFGDSSITSIFQGNVLIGTTTNAGYKLDVNGSVRIQEKLSVGTPTEVSAVLEVSSNTQGFLPPRMTTAQRDAIVSPATGLVLFNTTTDTLQVRVSTGWINL
jgi:hypothetical protein